MIALAKPMLGIEEKILVSEVLSSGKLAHGEYVEMFERDFALFQGSKHCVATSSRTSALHVALLSLGIKPEDKELADKARSLINHGQIAKYQHDVLGYNYRMTNIHAAIGIEQLRKGSFNTCLPRINRTGG
ncbi:DegT/DnrJ/EryC1/StrS family aminotransferase [Clostridium lundense]|uniref:DegT/DnrJ/EryC1/StrS family aminotransferase n=1 Tax=Clostridium lundense TaxID=319475 RepID=UPI000485ACA5|nr:DegT/DnrJ/EryC1/StrS family aminotransferase [Clostridium lundense]